MIIALPLHCFGIETRIEDYGNGIYELTFSLRTDSFKLSAPRNDFSYQIVIELASYESLADRVGERISEIMGAFGPYFYNAYCNIGERCERYSKRRSKSLRISVNDFNIAEY